MAWGRGGEARLLLALTNPGPPAGSSARPNFPNLDSRAGGGEGAVLDPAQGPEVGRDVDPAGLEHQRTGGAPPAVPSPAAPAPAAGCSPHERELLEGGPVAAERHQGHLLAPPALLLHDGVLPRPEAVAHLGQARPPRGIAMPAAHLRRHVPEAPRPHRYQRPAQTREGEREI